MYTTTEQQGTLIVGDWGTSRLRLFRVKNGHVVERLEGPGIHAAGAQRDTIFRTLLASFAVTDPPTRVVMCGMVGSRQGLLETPYVDCPVDIARWKKTAVQSARETFSLTVAAGAACRQSNGACEVMRGEETQIFGALSLYQHLRHAQHLIVLPGTHSKWVRIQDGRITSFRTFVTGELFALLRDHSTLTASPGKQTSEAEGFSAGLARASCQPLLGTLFEARTAQLRLNCSAAWALEWLSGLLIGHELNEGLGSFCLPEHIHLIGDPQLTTKYRFALQQRQLKTTEMDGDTCAVAGLQLLAAAREEWH